MEGEEREGRAARKRRSASRKKGRCFRNRRSAPGERSREEPSISSYSVAPGAMVDPPMAVAMVRLAGSIKRIAMVYYYLVCIRSKYQSTRAGIKANG